MQVTEYFHDGKRVVSLRLRSFTVGLLVWPEYTVVDMHKGTFI